MNRAPGYLIAAACLLPAPVLAADAAEACNNSATACITRCTVSGVIGIFSSGGKRNTSSNQECLDNCNRTQKQCLASANPAPGAAPAASGAAPNAAGPGGTLRWPSEGGIEQWAGFTRPSGCAPDLYYIKPMYDAVNAKIGMTIAFSETRNFYESPTVANFAKNPQALEIMQRDLDNFAKIGTDAREAATSVTKVSSGGETSAAIINQIRALQFDNLQCQNAAASGMRAQYFCGAAIKLVELTHRVEGMIQMACRMRVATPTYQAGVNQAVLASVPAMAQPAPQPAGVESASSTAPANQAIVDTRRSVGIPGARPARITLPGHNMENDATDCLEVSKIPNGYKYLNNCPYDLSFGFYAAGDLARGIGGPTGGKGVRGSYTWNPLYYGNEAHTYFACRVGMLKHHAPSGVLGCR